MGKGKIAHNKQFLFLQCFQRLVQKTCKNQGLFERGLTFYQTIKFRLVPNEYKLKMAQKLKIYI